MGDIHIYFKAPYVQSETSGTWGDAEKKVY